MSQQATATWVFPPDPSSCREARRRVTSVLVDERLEDAALAAAQVVSELATNAVLHARTPFEVRLLLRDAHVRIEVHDDVRRLPARRFFSDEAASGRGLAVVEKLSDAWGAIPDGDGQGKTVWAEVPTTPEPAEFDLDSVDDL